MSEKPKLTPQEINVQRLLARGLPNQEIAKKLGIGEACVKAHVLHIFKKTGATNRVQVALEWYGIVWRMA
jgi:DNA-binding NarL/FixJ family response regulator